MSLARDEGQHLVSDMLERFFAGEYALEKRRDVLSGDHPDRLSLWPHICGQGVLGVALPEAEGGAGGTVRDVAVVQELVGASLIVEPMLHSMLAITLFHQGGGFAEEIERIVCGEKIVAMAISESGDPFAESKIVAKHEGRARRLSGRFPVVRHGDIATSFIVRADCSGEVGFYLVDAAADGVDVAPLRLIDGSSASSLQLRGAPALLIGQGAGICEKANILMLVGLAVEASGICKKLVLDTAAYLKQRSQFGVPLASFQALQHRIADMHIGAEEAQWLVDRAIDIVDAGDPAALKYACMAKNVCDRAGVKIGHAAVQLHGGMGVSDELNISHMMKRLAGIRREFADADALSAHISGFGADLL